MCRSTFSAPITMRSRRHSKSGEVVLRDVIDADLLVFYEHQLDPEANRLVGFAPRDAAAFTTHWITVRANETSVNKTILFEGRVAGYIVSFERFGEREVGYWLGREFWGKGIATRALQDFLNHLPMRPLCARVAKHNGASLRVLQKCGFTIVSEGTFTSADGEEYEEHVLFLAD